jgi:hypothetical protein
MTGFCYSQLLLQEGSEVLVKVLQFASTTALCKYTSGAVGSMCKLQGVQCDRLSCTALQPTAVPACGMHAHVRQQGDGRVQASTPPCCREPFCLVPATLVVTNNTHQNPLALLSRHLWSSRCTVSPRLLKPDTCLPRSTASPTAGSAAPVQGGSCDETSECTSIALGSLVTDVGTDVHVACCAL